VFTLSMQKSHYNIAHILPWTTVGGVECATLRIAQCTEGREFKNIAFHLPEGNGVKQLFAKEGFDTVDYRAVELSYRHPLPFLRASYTLARELKRKKINLVHCSDLMAASYAVFAGKLAGIPVLCHIRCRFPELSRRDKSFLYSVNRFAFVSHDTWKNFAYKVPPHRGIVVYDGIEVPTLSASESSARVRREYNIPENAKIVGMVARVAPAKDYATLARAASRVIAADKNVRFLIVGDYSGTAAYQKHYEEVKQMLAANAVSEYFIFTDFQADVNRFLDAMDIFVLSTHGEGLPLVILEAMAQGKPVVAASVGGIPELVVHNETGFLYGHGDDAELSEQLLLLLRNDELSIRLGEKGRNTVRTKWTKARFAQDITDLYRQMLGGKKSGFLRSSDLDSLDQVKEYKI
jgi:glycosyltransferase involved in cell wall biosynthesis